MQFENNDEYVTCIIYGLLPLLLFFFFLYQKNPKLHNYIYKNQLNVFFFF